MVSEKRYALSRDYGLICTEENLIYKLTVVILNGLGVDDVMEEFKTDKKDEANLKFKELVGKYKGKELSWWDKGVKWYGNRNEEG